MKKILKEGSIDFTQKNSQISLQALSTGDIDGNQSNLLNFWLPAQIGVSS